jgi:hypothetical protein
MRAAAFVLLLSAALAPYASAYDAYDPANCNGADEDSKRPLTVEGNRAAAPPLHQEPLRRRLYGFSLSRCG